MKKIMFLGLALLTCILCSAKKPVKKQAQEKTKQEIYLDSLKMAVEIRLIQAEMGKAELEFRAKKEELDRMNRKPNAEFLINVQELELPCMSESNDTPEYYSGFGVGEGATDANIAVMNARMSALQDLQKKSGKEDMRDVEIVCKKIAIDRFGYYRCYMAVRMPKESSSNLSDEK